MRGRCERRLSGNRCEDRNSRIPLFFPFDRQTAHDAPRTRHNRTTLARHHEYEYCGFAFRGMVENTHQEGGSVATREAAISIVPPSFFRFSNP